MARISRKTRRGFFLAALFLLAAMLSVFAGCAGRGAEIVGIKIASPPYRFEYCAGESFDASGMEICAVYDDGTVETVTDFTVDKTILMLSDTYVTVTYKTFSVRQSVTVKASGAIISGGGVYTVEAEDLESASWKIQPGREGFGFVENDTHPAFNPASGGKCVGSLGSGTEIVFLFRTDAAYNVSFTVRMASVFSSYSLSTAVEFYIDGERIDPPEGVVFGYGEEYDETQMFTDWRDVPLAERRFESGSYEFCMKIVEQGCNIDAFFLTASPVS